MARTDDRFRAAHNRLLDHLAKAEIGQQLSSEVEMARELDVSRTVVRSVLNRLKAEGIIAWNGREKTVLRRAGAGDRLAVQADQLATDELERRFLDWVLRFDVPSGTALNITELTRRFGVPPYALQEFLASLSRFGLVRRRLRGGWELVGFTPDYAIELSDFRMVLELNAVSHLVRLSDEHPIWNRMEALKQDHFRLEAEIDERFHDFSLLDKEFHSAIGSVVTNRFAAEFQKVITLVFHYHYQWDKTLERERNEAAIHEHLRLIRALERRSETEALEAARDHLKTSKLTLLSSLRSNALD
ncbi:GntR family transcriptional regulator [Aurantimonas sp. Leaf443]|uniref:GntR family transcriptional regulator n=1 Tax=Aurantimonas sp. Leaf443 TaxID=1736378 RepID=UPI0006F7389B|nr:GntR family transcriptional regulator [Aurantimonas sp. Leaf443]KQT88464.1 transcriptional regulator [Aurantimonas sp. Leaf443]